MKTNIRHVLAAGLIMTVTETACGAGASHDDARGSAEILAVTSSKLTQADVTRVALTISGAGIDPAMLSSLAHVGGKWQGTIGGIPTGVDRTFHAGAFAADDTEIYAGERTGVAIVKNTKAFVGIILQQTAPPEPFHNSAPQIQSVYASSDTVEPLGALTVSAAAMDPDGDPFIYEWTSTHGTFANPAAASTSWIAPASTGTETLTLRVRDSKGASAAISFVVNVQTTAGTGSASVAASFNDAPSVDAISIDKNPIDAGDTVQLGVTTSDLDGDAVTAWEWSSTCVGSFSDPHVATPTFTMTARSGTSCAFNVKITDARAGWNTGQLNVAQGVPVAVDNAPVVDTTFQASDVADGGQTLVFRAKGHDPQGGALEYSWLNDGGTFGPTIINPSGESEITWTAPSCMSGDAHVSVVLGAPGGRSTTHTFTVIPGPTQTCGTTSTLEHVNVGADGLRLGTEGDNPSISADGRHIVFLASVPRAPGEPAVRQLFLRDRLLNTTTLVSAAWNGGGGGNQNTHTPSLAATGLSIVFSTMATDLFQTPFPSPSLFVRYDPAFPDNHLAPIVFAGHGFADAQDPQLSADGSRVCFTTFAGLVPDDQNGTPDVYVMDLPSGFPVLVSGGASVPIPGFGGGFCSISANGTKVSFSTNYPLVAGDTNGTVDTYVRDLSTGAVTLVTDGVSTGNGLFAAISGDGSKVAFTSNASAGVERIYVRTLASGALASATTDFSYAYFPALSHDGDVLAFVGKTTALPVTQIYGLTLSTGTAKLLSSGPNGPAAEAPPGRPSISADGHFVAFSTWANDLVPGDTDGRSDIFLATLP